MTERIHDSNSSARHEAPTDDSYRGGYAKIYEQVGVPMYQLPPKIIEALRRSGPSILEGPASRAVAGVQETAIPATSEAPVNPVVPASIEPVAVIDAPKRITPADVAKRATPSQAPAEAVIVPVIDTGIVAPVAHEATVLPNEVERYRPLPYRIERALAKSLFNRVNSVHDKMTVHSTERVDPAPESVAEIADNAIVNVPVTTESGEQHHRPKPFRTIKNLGSKALSRVGVTGEGLKSVWRQERKTPKMAFAIGALSVVAVFGADKVQAIDQYVDASRIMSTSAGDVYNPVSQKPISTLVIGGNTQTVGPVHEVDTKGYAPGSRDEAVVWAADMGIGNPGVSSEQSIEQGSGVLVDMYHANQAKGEHTHISAYSFGTYAAQDAAWRIYAENGNKWPSDITIDLIGGAQTDESIGKSAFGKVGMGLIGLRNGEHDRALPPGAQVRMFYNDRDPYASGGNESGLSLLYSIAGIPFGTHEVPDRNDPSVTWTMHKDANGIEHWVAHRKNEWVVDAIEKAGIKVMDTHSANEALRALFPRDGKEADVKKAMTLGARALDRQIDPTGKTRVFETIIEHMPEEWKTIINDGWNGINHAADAIAKAMADPTPANIHNAYTTVMNEIGKVMNGISTALGGTELEQGIKEWSVGSVSQIVRDVSREHFGQEINIESDLNQFADTLLASAKAYMAEAQAQAQNNQQPTGNMPASVSNIVTNIANTIEKNTAPEIKVAIPEQAPVINPVEAAVQQMPESSRVGMLPDLDSPNITVSVPNLPPVVTGPAPMSAPSTTTAETTAPSVPPQAEVPAVPVIEAPAPVQAPAPVYEAPAPTPAPAPVYEAPTPPPPPAPEYIPPAPMPAPVPAPVEVAPPAPAPPPAPVFEAPLPPPAPVFQFPDINIGGINLSPAPSVPSFSPPSIASIPSFDPPSVSSGMILEPSS